MKVICIKDDWKWAKNGRDYTPTDPKFGEVVTVINQMPYDGLTLYKLEGYNEWYDSRYFVPLSEIDETTFSRNYQKEPQL